MYMHHAFLNISFLFLHDCDMKMLNFAFYGGRNRQQRNFVCLSELGYGLLKLSFRRVHLHLTK